MHQAGCEMVPFTKLENALKVIDGNSNIALSTLCSVK